MNRVSKAAQAVHVAPQGTSGDIKALRQFGPAPVTLCLKERKQAEEASGRLHHGFVLWHKVED